MTHARFALAAATAFAGCPVGPAHLGVRPIVSRACVGRFRGSPHLRSRAKDGLAWHLKVLLWQGAHSVVRLETGRTQLTSMPSWQIGSLRLIPYRLFECDIGENTDPAAALTSQPDRREQSMGRDGIPITALDDNSLGNYHSPH